MTCGGCAQAGGDTERLLDLLRDFKGIGDTGAEIFAREVQVAWPELAPFYGSRGLEAAAALGFPADPDRLAALGDPATVGAALIRASLADD